MTRAPFIVIDGRLYRWKDILELRRAQLTAARPPSARHRGAICNQVCSPHYQAAIGDTSVIFVEVQKQPESLTSADILAKLSKHD
jgi:hypothetical protein